MNIKKLFVKSWCPHCRKTLVPTEMNNQNLRIKDRIDIIDGFEKEFFGMNVHPLISKVKFEAYPTLIFDGVKVTGFLSKRQTKECLRALTEDKKIVGEENPWT